LTFRLPIPGWTLALLAVPLTGCGGGPAEPAAASDQAATPARSMPGLFAGTASCSGRSCHGSLEPRPGEWIAQDEYTQWLTHDPHAQAYQVLLGEAAKAMARNLRIESAHEDVRCLSCHMTPSAAAALAEQPADPQREERLFGVGCESCHGAAPRWLDEHTLTAWRRTSQQAKRDLGFIPVDDLSDLARACAGCHVGAPPHGSTPARDVNHDLIAAGHPRLNFELSVYLANLPPHWNAQAKAATRDTKVHEARTWALGQLAGAEAALRLLDYRADADRGRPWPELAEYDCFACHHDLQGKKSWRQQDRKNGRPLGALPWGTWSFAMTRLLAADTVESDKALLHGLEEVMQHPAPDRGQVRAQASAAAQALARLGERLGPRVDRKLVEDWLHALGRDDRWSKAPSWDAAAQLYLAVSSLNQLYGDESLAKETQELMAALAFPRDPERFDSPRNFDPVQIDKLRLRLSQLRK
jgi:hypothetical protein